jgi:hypothetical protein
VPDRDGTSNQETIPGTGDPSPLPTAPGRLDEPMEPPSTAELEEDAKLAVEAKAEPDDPVELASDESFPASDPPASTHTHAGPPDPEH